MTEAEAAQNQRTPAQKKPAQKKQKFLISLVVFLALLFFGYLGFNYWKSSLVKRIQAQHDAQKFDNVESDIFDLSGNHDASKDDNLADISANELREKGAEFIYHLLLKNQVQLGDLSTQLQEVKSELVKYKSRERIGKTILAYVELRQEIFAGKNHNDALKNFELVAALDENLPTKIERLKSILGDFVPQETLQKDFAKLIPELILTKGNNPNPTFMEKVRRNLARLIIIRKIDGKNNSELDTKITEIEKFLHDENYQEALNLLLAFDQNYHNIIADFLNQLNAAVEMQKLDSEIMNYLKNLT